MRALPFVIKKRQKLKTGLLGDPLPFRRLNNGEAFAYRKNLNSLLIRIMIIVWQMKLCLKNDIHA
jgi:hypothetical protein